LVYFSADAGMEDITLRWKTASEINNDYFEIEKSADGYTFYQIGLIEGSGNSKETISYEFVDTNPLNGIQYYRLKQVDYDGTFEYSDIAQANFAGQVALHIYPNPVTASHVYINYQNAARGRIGISIFDLNGKIIKSGIINKTEGQLQSRIEFDVNPGIYILKIDTGNQLTTRKIIKR